jgi:hypothetical protein
VGSASEISEYGSANEMEVGKLTADDMVRLDFYARVEIPTRTLHQHAAFPRTALPRYIMVCMNGDPLHLL